MNLHRLSAGKQGGLGYLKFPIVSRDQAILFAAYYYAVIEYRTLKSKEVNDASKAVREAQQKISEIQGKLEKMDASSRDCQRITNNLKEWREKLEERHAISAEIWKQADSIYNGYADAIQQRTSPEWAKTVKRIAESFNAIAKAQLGSNVTSVDGLIEAIVELATVSPNIVIRNPFIANVLDDLQFREAGDKGSKNCYVCGRPMRKDDKEFSITRLIFEKPTTRPQSGGAETKLPACADCAAIALTSPFKLGDSGILVRLEFKHDGQGEDVSLQDYVRMLTLGELNLAAGRYLLISCQDYAGKGAKRKSVMTQMGKLQYALVKLASILPRETLRECRIWLESTSPQELPIRWMVWLNYLQSIFRLETTYRDKKANVYKPNRATFEAIRLVQKEEVIKAIYALVSADSSQVTQLTDHSFES